MKEVSSRSIFWGVLLLLIGLGFLFGGLGIINFGKFFTSYWPLIFVFYALAQLLDGKYFSFFIWLCIGTILELNILGLMATSFWTIIWPLILILVGLKLLAGTFNKENVKTHKNESVTATGIFSGDEKNISTKNFSFANLVAIFGGAKIILSESEIAKDGAIIDTLTIFGGTEIVLPKDQPVNLNVTAIFGGSEDKRNLKDVDKNKPVIKIQGLVLFGGVEIKD